MNITFFCPINLSSQQQSLSNLLAVGKDHMLNLTMSELICQRFDVQATPDYPLAALSRQADTHTQVATHTTAAYYLQADPVHLVLQRDAFSLSDPATLTISNVELTALCDALNQHFMPDGLTFELSNQKLQLRLENTPKISTTLPEKVVGRNVYAYLPQGENASYWNKIINEIQMLLHEHSINQQREMIGLPAINSIWLSGGGALPMVASTAFDKVYTDVSYVRGLAQLANMPCHDLPKNKKIEFNQHSNLLIIAKSAAELEVWANALYQLVRQGATLQLNLAFQDTVLVSDIKPLDSYKFWLKILHKNKSPSSYFQDFYTKMQSKTVGAKF